MFLIENLGFKIVYPKVSKRKSERSMEKAIFGKFNLALTRKIFIKIYAQHELYQDSGFFWFSILPPD